MKPEKLSSPLSPEEIARIKKMRALDSEAGSWPADSPSSGDGSVLPRRKEADPHV